MGVHPVTSTRIIKETNMDMDIPTPLQYRLVAEQIAENYINGTFSAVWQAIENVPSSTAALLIALTFKYLGPSKGAGFLASIEKHYA